eukprot:TRINITY_DN1563_c0_g1_i1.p1 TRINITY_DN1563_c0_g1~~TRINITY_DN1563_c0_g1_i1.p1  ORF type:complete len:535 (-),score=153.29 TRINITY_DN1563_c0_g1_i1:11-1615(-)
MSDDEDISEETMMRIAMLESNESEKIRKQNEEDYMFAKRLEEDERDIQLDIEVEEIKIQEEGEIMNIVEDSDSDTELFNTSLKIMEMMKKLGLSSEMEDENASSTSDIHRNRDKRYIAEDNVRNDNREKQRDKNQRNISRENEMPFLSMVNNTVHRHMVEDLNINIFTSNSKEEKKSKKKKKEKKGKKEGKKKNKKQKKSKKKKKSDNNLINKINNVKNVNNDEKENSEEETSSDNSANNNNNNNVNINRNNYLINERRIINTSDRRSNNTNDRGSNGSFSLSNNSGSGESESSSESESEDLPSYRNFQRRNNFDVSHNNHRNHNLNLNLNNNNIHRNSHQDENDNFHHNNQHHRLNYNNNYNDDDNDLNYNNRNYNIFRRNGRFEDDDEHLYRRSSHNNHYNSHERRRHREEILRRQNFDRSLSEGNQNPWVRSVVRNVFVEDESDDLSYEELLRLEDNNVPKGASKSQIKNLQQINYVKSEEESKCTICLDDFEEGDQLNLLSCFHKFHTHCIKDWFQHSKLCPICRHEIEK